MEIYERDLIKFDELCEELKKSKFIVAEIKIMKLLKCIADSPILITHLESCMEGFNYEYEYIKAKSPNEDEDNENKFSFNLPIEPSKKVALIFRILYDIDIKVLDLQKFIFEYFVVDDEPYSSYQNFIEKVIVPFQDDFEYIVTGIKRFEEFPIMASKDKLNLKEKYLIDIVEILKKTNKIIESEELKVGQKEEMTIMTNGFANSLISIDPEHILVSWIGFKNTLRDCKKAIPMLKKVEDRLKNSGLFDKK